MSRSSLSMPDLSLWKRGVIVLVSALAHGLVLAATLIWSQRELPVPAQSSSLVELEFDAPAPIPDAPVAAPRPMPAPMPEPVPDVTPEPRSLQAPPPPDKTKNELRDAPPKARVSRLGGVLWVDFGSELKELEASRFFDRR